MEALYLLCSIASTCVTTSLLSLLLPFQTLASFLSRFFSSSNEGRGEEISYYQGHVRHVRRRPVHHAFDYDVRYALVDLDRNSASLPASFFRCHVSAQEARHITGTTGPVLLLTIPPSVGYEQNPLSVYYCYDAEGSTMHLKKCIAEVTNTPWGERVLFVFNPDSDLVAKPLHVSPFMDMLGNWTMRANAPGEDLFIAISVQHPTLGNYFTATLKAKRVRSSSWTLRPALFFWLMPQKVAVWIYWQALKLWWKNVSFLKHPKYVSPLYKEEALTRDRKLQCSRTVAKSDNSHLCFDNDQNHEMNTSTGDRWCVWKDAQWPWS
ncbi:DUF1365 family protein [Tasmannia lanceolata]|uniref:DUF1365 family protein n=1 Tax=Tasmannia lanceolata TaxID=3420 RepID=UPI00406436D1